METPRNAPPVAVRVMRPYAEEDELLNAESNAFTRTGVVLLGAPSRPNGVVIRFEICLRDGTAVMRGEGRVVGFRPAADEDESALMLRFTRLDVKSKTLLDRAVAMREERRSLAPADAPKRPSTAPPPPPKPSTAPPPPETSRDVEPPPPPVVAAPPPAPPPIEADDDVMDVDDADLQSEDDQTVQAPPVAMIADMHMNERKEKAPIPQPSPAGVPVPQPIAPVPQAPPQRAPEPAPPQAPPKERMPIPQRSPGPEKHSVAALRERASGEFRPSLQPEQRDSALDRLRQRSTKPGA